MKPISIRAAVLVLLLRGGLAPAHADLSAGVRLGGYGFRDAPSAVEGQTSWRACRMNGLGIFGEYQISDAFYAEIGIDGYFVDNWIAASKAASEGWALDRTSMLVTGAAGARAWSDKRISPNVHIGVGGEYTQVTLDGWVPIKKRRLGRLGS